MINDKYLDDEDFVIQVKPHIDGKVGQEMCLLV